MAIRSDSYGSVAEVKAFTKHLLSGQPEFNTETNPTLTEVEKFIDRVSGILNTALNNSGFTTPVTNSTAKLVCDDWVVARASEYVELTQRGVGYSGAEGSRTGGFKKLYNDAEYMVNRHRRGFQRLGAGVTHKASEGLAFTGLTEQDDRTDPDSTTIEQPKFTRGQFDNEG